MRRKTWFSLSLLTLSAEFFGHGGPGSEKAIYIDLIEYKKFYPKSAIEPINNHLETMKNNNMQKNTESQRGVTLLLAILVLSAISAISFSLAAVVLVEIRASGDLQRTEPALYATQGVIEQAIFKVQRDVPDAQMCFDPNTLTDPTKTNCLNNTPIKSNINVVTISSVGAQDISQSPLSESISASYNTTSNTKNIYSIYDADNPNNPQYGYTFIRVENRSNVLLRYGLCRVNDTTDPNGPSDCSPSTYPAGSASWIVPPDTAIPALSYVERTLTKTYIYRMYVYQNTGATAPAFVDVYSYGPANAGDTCVANACAAKGLPLKGKKQVDVTATNANLTRRYRVLVPLSK